MNKINRQCINCKTPLPVDSPKYVTKCKTCYYKDKVNNPKMVICPHCNQSFPLLNAKKINKMSDSNGTPVIKMNNNESSVKNIKLI